ncbi:hypothetical protein CLPUN_31470 [Clostridium puniceum]|uniref:Uncharacterized protein n=1 Tax=Clostridium puniceum TaxID=29367 RepID=A0A1S8TDI8_9CLOT|nr:hypothetical protein [Clostridium puniceum]OOM75682.1 hypothetical protein CLPUN_31470 [Clostridium puniceum]
MSVYMITYFISDTTGHSHDHGENCGCGENHTHSHEHKNSNINIIGKIKSLGAWAQFLPEGFFIKTSSTAEEIFAEVNSVANKGDIIFVTKVDAKSSACANPAVLAWLAE